MRIVTTSSRLIAILLLIAVTVTANASDAAKEKRWADQIVDSLLDGEAIYLKADGQSFLTIWTPAEDATDKAMIVVHGTGIHPNWDQVIYPVRTEMITRGWHTLSIQMPILHNEATYEEYVPLYPEVPGRLKAAEAFLKEQGAKTTVIVAHSQGATMSAYYLSRNAHNVSAFVAIGMGASQKDADINSAESLKKISIPVLDLYGSDDLESVLKTREQRKDAAAKNSDYSQVIVEDANHFFDDHDDALIEKINSWLANQ